VAAESSVQNWLNDTQPLVISSYTLGTEVPFDERVRVAAGAGFAGIGLRAENYWDALEAGLDDVAMKDILNRHAVAVMEVEYLTAWGTEQDRDSAQQEKERTVYHMARTFGVEHVNAGMLEKLPVDVLTDAYTKLCRRAGELIVGLEFMPYSGVPDIDTAWAVVSGAGQPNGALLMDGWHWSRAAMTPADLEPVPAEKIVSIQLCDVAEEPMEPLRAESLGHRLLPGKGYGDVLGMVSALAAKNVDPKVVTLEVISNDLVGRGLDVAAATSYAAARELLAAVREGT
jgi:sugar phosphate isomerase/epimerase